MATVFVDECGYTGQALLDPAQPVFVLASLGLSEADCQNLRNQFFGKIQAAELKHSSISKFPKQQKMVLEFLSYLCSDPGTVKVFAAHKKYTLTTRMVELIIEPSLNTCQTTLLTEGQNIFLSNVFFHLTPAIAGRQFFDDLLHRFQEMIREGTCDSYDRFFGLVFKTKEPAQLVKLLSHLKMGYYSLGYSILNSDHPLDITRAFMLGLMERWRKQLGVDEEIHLIPDRNSSMTRSQEFWDVLTGSDIPKVRFDFDKNCQWDFPIDLKKTLVNQSSKDWVGVQLADVLAGATCKYLEWCIEGNPSDNQYAAQLQPLLEELVIPESAIWPNDSMPVEILDRLWAIPL